MFVQLRPAVQNYAWGKVGSNSTVAQLIKNDGAQVDESKPYAEVWYGTHPSGPAVCILPDGQSLPLSEYIARNPEASLGKEVLGRWPGPPSLPFLLKKPLSIQAHPDKKLAEALHAKFPDIYKDPNHKPEMAVAVTEFEALCGFKAAQEIAQCLESVPELATAVGADAVATFRHTILNPAEKKAALRGLFTALMTAPAERVSRELAALVSRLQEKHDKTPLERLLLRVHAEFPGDVGNFGLFFLNYIILQPGQALFLAANEPHACIHHLSSLEAAAAVRFRGLTAPDLRGDCVECMATSDNVVRAGLTPKHKDVETLCSMLTYLDGVPRIWVGEQLDANRVTYRPPVPEFSIERIAVPPRQKYSLPVEEHPSILLVLEGSGTLSQGASAMQVRRGNSFFVSASAGQVDMESQDSQLVVFRATTGIMEK